MLLYKLEPTPIVLLLKLCIALKLHVSRRQIAARTRIVGKTPNATLLDALLDGAGRLGLLALSHVLLVAASVVVVVAYPDLL